MPAVARSYVSTGVALAGAFAVTAAQLVPPVHEAETRMVRAAVSLTAAGGACSGYNTDGCDIWAPQAYTPVALNPNGSAANIAANIVNAVASIPRAYVNALNDLSYSLEQTGSWWVYSPTNALGFDPADPLKLAALVNLSIPFAPLSHAIGDQLSWWARANLPTNPGCTGNVGPTCADFGAILNVMFKAPLRTLAAGYQFPVIYDPISDAEGAAGQEIPGSTGAELPWSGAYVKFNLADAFNSVSNYLKSDPALNKPERVTGAEFAAALARLGAASKLGFYPFVPKSFLLKGWPYTALTPLFTPFIKQLCPTCDPANPGGPGLDVTSPGPQPPAAAAVAAPSVDATTVAATSVDATPAQTKPADASPVTTGGAKNRTKVRAAAAAPANDAKSADTGSTAKQRRAAQRAARVAAAADTAADTKAGAGAGTSSAGDDAAKSAE